MNIPAQLKYTTDHEWVRIEGDMAFIGITDYAQGELGEIVYVDVPTEGETVAAGEVFGSIEAVKTVADLLMPVEGEVVQPELVNNDPYGEGWIIKVKMADPAKVETLMDAAAYSSFLG